MGNDRFRFITAHVLQQPGADGDQRGVTTRAGGEGVNVRRVIDSYLRHGNTYLLRLLLAVFISQRSVSLRGCSITSPPTDFSAIHFDIISETIEPPKPNSRAIIRRPVMLLD